MKETHKKQGTKHRTNRGREVFRKKIGRKLSLSKKKTNKERYSQKNKKENSQKEGSFCINEERNTENTKKRGKKH